MAIESRRDTIINDRMYSILLPPPRKVMPLCTKMAVLFAAVLPTLQASTEDGGFEKFGAAMKSVDPMAIDNAFMEAVSISHLCCNNEPISSELNFDKHFTNYRQEVYQVCLWVLWECIKDFFPELDVLNHLSGGMMETASKSRKNGQ